MRLQPTELPGVVVIEVDHHEDGRGLVAELYQCDRYAAAGIAGPFVQDTLSRSARGVVRGLHFQEPAPQGKLVQVLSGAIYDVAVDVRRGSLFFGRFVAIELSDATPLRQLWVPPGFAHGFCALGEPTVVLYKCTALWDRAAERVIAWDDPDLAIPWPVAQPVVSDRDCAAPRLRDALVLPVLPISA